MSAATISDKQRLAFKTLVGQGIPETIREHSTDVGDYVIEFEPFPVSMDKMISDDGTDYLPIKAACTIVNKVTAERIQFNVDLLQLPAFQELGFKIRGNYMQMLDLYERTPGWCFTTKTTGAGVTTIKGALLATNGRNFSFLYDNKCVAFVSFKANTGTSDKGAVSVSTFFRAITGMTNEELLDMFGYENSYVMTAFSDNAKAHPESKDYALGNRNDCIEALADACLGRAQAARLGNLAMKQRDIMNYLFSPNYTDLGDSYAMRLEYTQSYCYRAVGKTLAEDVVVGDKRFITGTILSNEDLEILDVAPIPYLKVNYNGKVYCLRKFSHFVFPVYGYVLSKDVPELNLTAGTLLDMDTLKMINDSDVEQIYAQKDNRSNAILFKRRKYANSLEVEDLYTAFAIWANNLNGFDTFDKQYELTNRIIVPFDKAVLNIINKNLNTVTRMLTSKLHVASVSDSMVGTIPDFSRKINLSEFISMLRDASDRAGQQSDMCNIMAFVSKNHKATSTVKADNVTPDMVDVQDLQEGRLDPFDVPESNKIGIVHHRTILAQLNSDGYLTAPYLQVKNGEVLSEEPVYLSATEEAEKYIAQWNETFRDENGELKGHVKVRCNGDVANVDTSRVTLKEYSPYQGMSPAHAAIPFPGHSNGKRITMGINQPKQAMPLVYKERPLVNGGGESIMDIGTYTAQDVLEQYYSALAGLYPKVEADKSVIMNSRIKLTQIEAENNMRYVTFKVLDAKPVLEKHACKYEDTVVFSFPYLLKNFENGVFSYKINHVPEGIYEADSIIAYNNGYSLDNPEHVDLFDTGSHKIPEDALNKGIALVKNLVVFYKTYGGSTIDDAITIGSHLNTEDALTSVSMYTVKAELKKSEAFGINASGGPNYFQYNGLPTVGTYLRPEDPVISKIDESGNRRNARYVYLKPYVQGQVVDAKINVVDGKSVAVVVIAHRSTVEPGDKLAGRCGNKGVIARIVPYEQMPYDPETGLVADIVLNPLGIPSRQNITQLLEVALSMCMKMDGKISYVSPYNKDDLDFVREQAAGHGVHPTIMVDGRTGLAYERPINYGVISMFKLHHMVHKKIHAIGMDAAVDPVFLQPRKGSKLEGGQSFGEMESWCLEGIGATKVLQNLYSFQSDDVDTKNEVRSALEQGDPKLASVFSPEGENHNDLSMQACYRTLGVEFITNTEEGCYEFAPLGDKIIKSLSVKPVTDEKSLHATSIFGKNGSVADKAHSRTMWGWMDLHCKIVNPLWIEKGNLNKLLLVETVREPAVERASSNDLKDLIAGDLYLAPVESSKCALALYTLENKAKPKFPHVSEAICDSADLLTGLDAIVWIFENFNTVCTETFHNNALAKARKAKEKQGVPLSESQSYLTLVSDSRFVSDFNSGKYQLKDYLMSSFPVMPQTYRPNIEMDIRKVPDFDWHYSQILKAIKAVQLEHNPSTLFTLYERIRLFQGLGKADLKYNKKYQNVLNYFMGKDKNDNHGKIRNAMQSKRIVCSGRTTIIPAADTTMLPTEIGVPISMLVRMYESPLIGLFKSKCTNTVPINNSFWKKLLMAIALNNKVTFERLYSSKFEQCFEKPWHTMIYEMKSWIVDFIEHDQVVIAGRQPSLHKYSIRAYQPKVVYTKAINIHPLVCKGYNADFDGDQMWVAAILTDEAKEEAMDKMCAARDFLNPKNSSVMLEHSQDIALGIYCATMLKDNVDFYPYSISDVHHYSSVTDLELDVKSGLLKTYDLVCISVGENCYLSTAGRILFNSLMGCGFTDRPFSNPLKIAGINEARYKDLAYDGIITSGKGSKGDLVYHSLQGICKELYFSSNAECIQDYQAFAEFGFYFSDKFGVSLSLEDLDVKSNKQQILQEAAEKKVLIEKDFRNGLISANDKKDAIAALYNDKDSGAIVQVKKGILGNISRNNNIFIMTDSGARGNESQIMHMCGAIGSLQKTKTENMEDPVTSNYYEGLDAFDVHMASYSSRTGIASTQNETSKAGYATHQVVFMSGGVKIVEEDCGKTDWHFDVLWGDRIDSLDKFLPSQEWFRANLLGHTIDASDTEAIKCFGVDESRVITEASFANLCIREGFHSVTLEGRALPIEVSIDDLNDVKLKKSDVYVQHLLAKLLQGGRMNRRCITALERKHVKTIETENGIYNFRYKIDAGCRSALLYREARNLPHLMEVSSFTTGDTIDVITEDTLQYVESSGIDVVEARVTFDCHSKHGICAHCYGLKYSNLQLPLVGDYVGTEAAQAIGEPAAQLTMSLINKGGAAGESVASGVEIFESLLSGKVPGADRKDSAMVAQTSGYIKVDKLDETVALTIEPEDKMCAMCQRCKDRAKQIVCPREVAALKDADPMCLIQTRARASLVIPQNGEWVDSGDQITKDAMTEFVVAPDRITSVAGNTDPEVVMRRKQVVWMLDYYNTFKANNIIINARQFEVLAHIQNQYVRVISSECPDVKEGQVYEFSEVRDHLDEVELVMHTSKRSDVILNNSGAMTALAFEDNANVAAKLVVTGHKSYANRNNALIGAISIGANLKTGEIKQVNTPVIQEITSEEADAVPTFGNFDIIEDTSRESSVDLDQLSQFSLDALGSFDLDFSMPEEPTAEPEEPAMTEPMAETVASVSTLTSFGDVFEQEEDEFVDDAIAPSYAETDLSAEEHNFSTLDDFLADAEAADDEVMVSDTFAYAGDDFVDDDENDFAEPIMEADENYNKVMDEKNTVKTLSAF